MKRSLKSSPSVVTIGMIWDSAKPDETLVTSVMQSVDCSIHTSCVSFSIHTATTVLHLTCPYKQETICIIIAVSVNLAWADTA